MSALLVRDGHMYAVLVRTSAIMRSYKPVTEVRIKKSCGYAVPGLQNWTNAYLIMIQMYTGHSPISMCPFPYT